MSHYILTTYYSLRSENFLFVFVTKYNQLAKIPYEKKKKGQKKRKKKLIYYSKIVRNKNILNVFSDVKLRIFLKLYIYIYCLAYVIIHKYTKKYIL